MANGKELPSIHVASRDKQLSHCTPVFGCYARLRHAPDSDLGLERLVEEQLGIELRAGLLVDPVSEE